MLSIYQELCWVPAKNIYKCLVMEIVLDFSDIQACSDLLLWHYYKECTVSVNHDFTDLVKLQVKHEKEYNSFMKSEPNKGQVPIGECPHTPVFKVALFHRQHCLYVCITQIPP